MFTGIIEEKGSIIKINTKGDKGSLEVACKTVLNNTKIGDSIAVNGVCLTVTTMTDSSFTADVMQETFRRSNLGLLSRSSHVNLERAMACDGRFGGHIVSGHIDGTGTVSRLMKEGNATWVFIRTSDEILSLIVEKGSITIDGISLTVARLTETDFAVSIIPHTGEETTLLERKVGDTVNLENDIIGKYVQRLMGKSQSDRDNKLLNWLNS